MKKLLCIIFLIFIKQINAQCVLTGTLSGAVIDTAICNIPNNGNITGLNFSSPNGTAPYHYQWYNYYINPNYYSPLQNDTLLNLSNVLTGNYALQITDANGCKTDINDASFIFNVPNSISVSLQLFSTVSNTITLTVQYSPHVTSAIWNWFSSSNDTALYPTHNFSSAYTHTVCVEAIDSANGCTAYNCTILNLCQTCSYSTMSVDVTQNGVITTGIEQSSAINHTQIYPNPNNGNFIINTKEEENQSLKIFDVTGKLMLSETLNAKKNIDVSYLIDGIYFLQTETKTGTYMQKLLIEHN